MVKVYNNVSGKAKALPLTSSLFIIQGLNWVSNNWGIAVPYLHTISLIRWFYDLYFFPSKDEKQPGFISLSIHLQYLPVKTFTEGSVFTHFRIQYKYFYTRTTVTKKQCLLVRHAQVAAWVSVNTITKGEKLSSALTVMLSRGYLLSAETLKPHEKTVEFTYTLM